MSYFGKELWTALTRPFKLKEDSECHKWVNVLGGMMDDVADCIKGIRLQWTIKYTTGAVLDLRGAERGIFRWYGENDDDYRKRVEGAFALYAAGGTLPGMKMALRQIGYGDVEITERSPTWAKFLLSFDFSINKPMGRREWDILNFSVWQMKSAHTMPRYFMTFRPEPPQKIEVVSKPRIDGEIHIGHPILWTIKKFYYIDGSLTLNGAITLGDGWCDATYLDGTWLLGGDSLLDGYTAVEGDGWRWRDNPLHRTRLEAEIGPKRPFANQIYWLDGREKLDGGLLLDALKETNTKIAHHRAYVEEFKSGVSQGRKELH